MSAFTDKRVEVQATLASFERMIQDLLAEAGRMLVESGHLPAEEPYSSLLEADRRQIERIGTLRSTHERIVAIGERLAEIAKARAELEHRGRELGAELEPHYRTIGENAFRVFRDNPLIDQEYADIFTPVLDAAEEIKQSRSELARAEAELSEKPFLEKMVLRGRIIVLRNRLSLRESALERLYKDAGRQIAGTDFITTIGDPGLDEAAAPFLDLMDESRRIEQEMAVLDEERASLRSELSGLGVERRPAARISELDHEIEQAESTRRESLIQIATAVAGSDLAQEVGGEAADRFEEIAQARRREEAARDRLARIDAALEAERLSGDRDQVDASMKRKRDQIESITGDINELERKKADLARRIEAAEARRGPVEDLLA